MEQVEKPQSLDNVYQAQEKLSLELKSECFLWLFHSQNLTWQRQRNFVHAKRAGRHRRWSETCCSSTWYRKGLLKWKLQAERRAKKASETDENISRRKVSQLYFLLIYIATIFLSTAAIFNQHCCKVLLSFLVIGVCWEITWRFDWWSLSRQSFVRWKILTHQRY